MTFFEMNDVTFRYTKAGRPVVARFNLAINQGEIVGILGASGCGKSTVLRLIAGLELPETGKIVIAGQTVFDAATFVTPENRGVGMVFQDYALFPHLTVEHNITFGLHRWPRRERRKRLDAMLELVHLSEYRHRYPHELSGGQQQRVALARALAPEPAILLMDEPFSNLDAGLRGQIREELKQILKTAGMTCILVTHDKEDVEAICDRTIHMS